MLKILYTRPDGGVSIICPVPKEKTEQILGTLTDEQYIQHILDTSVPSDATNVRQVTDDDLPSDREFRDAWVDTQPGTQVDVCCDRAKDVSLARLRVKRNQKLAELDVQGIKLLDMGLDEELAAVRQEKQKLRDITDSLKAVNTEGKVNNQELLDELKSLEGVL